MTNPDIFKFILYTLHIVFIFSSIDVHAEFAYDFETRC